MYGKPSHLACLLMMCLLAWSSQVPAQDSQSQESTDGIADCGTLVSWHTDPDKAKELAQRLNKPLLILHLSGDFQNEEFT